MPRGFFCTRHWWYCNTFATKEVLLIHRFHCRLQVVDQMNCKIMSPQMFWRRRTKKHGGRFKTWNEKWRNCVDYESLDPTDEIHWEMWKPFLYIYCFLLLTSEVLINGLKLIQVQKATRSTFNRTFSLCCAIQNAAEWSNLYLIRLI